MAGVAGNLVGSWIAYAVGYYGGRPFVERYGRYVLLRPHHLDLAERLFARYGPVTVFFGRMLPIVRTFISLPAGFGRMPFWKFTLYTVLGCMPWVLLLGYVGEKLGSNWEKIRPLLHYLDYAVVVALVALVVWAIVRRRGRTAGSGRRRRRRRVSARARSGPTRDGSLAGVRRAPDASGSSLPATTANLGPGFDCLGLALDLWNVATFTLDGEGVEVRVAGEGSGRAARTTPTTSSCARSCASATRSAAPMPAGLRIDCEVARAALVGPRLERRRPSSTGLLGANELLGRPVDAPPILALAAEIEGHPDNVAAALYGGLVVVVNGEEGLLTERIEVRPIEVALAVSQIEYSTSAARAELPTYVALADAVFNMGRAALVVEALRRGDLELLGKAMDDRLHQAQRLEHMPGGPDAMAAARDAGAAAVAVSGSGPSLIAFPAPGAAVGDVAAAMVDALAREGVRSRPFTLATTDCGAAAHPGRPPATDATDPTAGRRGASRRTRGAAAPAAHAAARPPASS